MGLCGVWGEVQRPSGAGSAASPQAAPEGLRKKVLKMDRPVGRKVQRVLAVPLRAHYKKRRPGFISQRGIGKH